MLIKGKNHMIISFDAEKASNQQNLIPSHEKNTQQIRKSGTSSIDKGHLVRAEGSLLRSGGQCEARDGQTDTQVGKEEVNSPYSCTETPSGTPRTAAELWEQMSRYRGPRPTEQAGCTSRRQGPADQHEIKTVPLRTAPERVRYLGMHLTKEVQNIYSENHKMLLREMKDPRKGRVLCCRGGENLKESVGFS